MAKDHKTDGLDDLRGQPSPRTTIVGGRPPEGAPSRFPVPTGIQRLLHLAAASPEFLRLLLQRRAKVAEAAGVGLTGSEVAVLGAISDGQLAAMAGAVPRSSLGPSSRQVAAAAVVLLGGAGSVACDFAVEASERVQRSEMATEGGAAPDEPPPRDTAAPPMAGVAPDVPEVPPPTEPGDPPTIPELEEPALEPIPHESRPTRGIRPDIPPDRVDVRPMETSGGAEPDEPPPRIEHALPNAGVRPDLYPPVEITPTPAPTEPTLEDEEWKTRAGMSATLPEAPAPEPPAEDEPTEDQAD